MTKSEEIAGEVAELETILGKKEWPSADQKPAQKKETAITTLDKGNVLDFLDQSSLSQQAMGPTTLKAKRDKEQKKAYLEIRQGELKTVVEELDCRIILWTDQYQLSRKSDDNFGTIATTSELYPGRTDPQYLYDHEQKLYEEIEQLTDFTKRYPKDQLKKSEELKRYKILYVKTEMGIIKLYLKPSQYVGCFIEKSGYRYSNPIEGTLGDIEKKFPVKWYNKMFKIRPAVYEKNGFDIAYPTFVEPTDSKFDPQEALLIFNEIIWSIKSAEKSRMDSEDWDRNGF